MRDERKAAVLVALSDPRPSSKEILPEPGNIEELSRRIGESLLLGGFRGERREIFARGGNAEETDTFPQQAEVAGHGVQPETRGRSLATLAASWGRGEIEETGRLRVRFPSGWRANDLRQLPEMRSRTLAKVFAGEGSGIGLLHGEKVQRHSDERSSSTRCAADLLASTCGRRWRRFGEKWLSVENINGESCYIV